MHINTWDRVNIVIFLTMITALLLVCAFFLVVYIISYPCIIIQYNNKLRMICLVSQKCVSAVLPCCFCMCACMCVCLCACVQYILAVIQSLGR